MAEVRMRPKHQITLPASVVKAAKLETDDRMQVEFSNGVIVITPVKQFASKIDAMSYAGIGKGLWGKTPQQLDNVIGELRDSWER